MSPVLQSKLRVLRAIRHKAGDALCEADYRAILKRCAGVESSTEIRSLAKADAVLAEFARLGLGTLPKRQPLTGPQKKMWSLWQQLADAGRINNRSMAGLEGFVKRQTGVEALKWLTWAQEMQLVESLKRWLERGDGVADA